MALKLSYAKKEDIPQGFDTLYTEKDGKFELTGIEGMKTQADVDRVQEALRKEKNDHKAAKEQLKAWTDLGEDVTPDTVREQLDRIPTLEAAGAKGAEVEEKIKKAVEAAKVALAQGHERELKKLTKERDELKTANDNWSAADRKRQIRDAVRTAATNAKLLPEAHEDALLLGEAIFEINDQGQVVTRDNVGITPGLDAATWLGEIQAKRPHWWPPSQGGGAGGSGGGGGGPANPWSSANWSITEQGAYITKHGAAAAEKAAKSVGSFVGATAPPKKAA